MGDVFTVTSKLILYELHIFCNNHDIFFFCEKQEDIILHVPCEGDDCIIYETSPYPTPTPNGFPLMIIPDDNPLTFEG